MKTQIFLLILIILLNSCSAYDNSFTKNKAVMENDVIYADDYYYSQAVNEYDAVKNILFGLSTRDQNNAISLMGKILENGVSAKEELLKKGFINCIFIEPSKLKDLDAGFQFKQYFFTSNNRAALNAFGIANVSASKKLSYLVIDYLQYKDIMCYKLPTIRYAVGIRAEFTIHDSNIIFKGNGIGSLAQLAMDVESNKKKVDISIKTIGITGLQSRVPLPENNNFDISTFADFKAVLTFIKTMKDGDAEGEITFAPQIIPVLDKYRSNLESSVYANIEKIDLLKKSIENAKLDEEEEWKREVIKNLKDASKELYNLEVTRIRNNKERLVNYSKFIQDNSSVNSLIRLDSVATNIFKKPVNDTKPNEKDIIGAAIYQLSLNKLLKAKEIVSDCNGEDCDKVKQKLNTVPVNGKQINLKKISEELENKYTDKTEIKNIKNEKWLYICTVDRNSLVQESIINELKVNDKYDLNMQSKYSVNTDANIRDNHPEKKEDDWMKGIIIDVLKENKTFTIQEITRIPGGNNETYIWARILY
ncbi:hypothetical protein [Chryseobacterium jejuense]|uniref:Uncharacterized protein n=1 Tax=Chryseobacterium jejuense TaxID=445960 RepID=A0A2X2XFV4_CHRJE|nr:hypothetical protein [Chryseobacterium jejuense]SDI52800.1 hypothetical protein SAMN05421542_1198 [Chryseobacterium jejuense]SQB46935.1 Uncharacterised protein [Chryseobacterium jejuense]